MLTMQRPIKAKGAFDIDVNLVNDQYIFWSVGYKSAAMRKKYKPLKNADPIAVNFGRKPVWNCLTAGKGNRQADQGKSLIYNFRRVNRLPAREISRQITKCSCGFCHLTIFF